MNRKQAWAGLAIVALVAVWVATVQAGSFVGTMRLGLNATHTDTSETVPTGGAAAAEKFADWVVNQSLTAGTNANQVNMFFPKSYTLTNTQSQTVDISGSVTDTFGETVTITECRFLVVTAAAANSNRVQMSWSPYVDAYVDVQPGGAVMFWAPDAGGYGVTNAASDSIVITNNSGASATVSVLVGGSN